MQLSLDQRGDVCIVRVGEAKFTYPVLVPFFTEVRRIVEQGARKLVIDLQAITYIDSASIGCLIDVHHLLDAHGGCVKLSSPQPRVHTMLSLVLTDKIVEVYKDEAAALAAFGGAAPAARPARGDAARHPRGPTGGDRA